MDMRLPAVGVRRDGMAMRRVAAGAGAPAAAGVGVSIPAIIRVLPEGVAQWRKYRCVRVILRWHEPICRGLL